MTTSPTSIEPENGERRIYWAFVDCWTVVRRDLTHLVKQPSVIAWQLGFPIVSVLLFVYVFGSAMDVGDGTDYKSFAMPGMFAMTIAFGFMNTAFAVVIDKEKGVTDRFRSMPMSPSAVVTDAASPIWCTRAWISSYWGRSDGGLLATLTAFRSAAPAALRPDMDRRLPGADHPQPGGRRQPVCRRLPLRDDLERLHASQLDAGVARRHRDVEPGLVHGQRHPGALRHPDCRRRQLDRGERDCSWPSSGRF